MATAQSLMLRVVSFTIAIAILTPHVYAQFVPRFDGRSFGLEVTGEYFTSDENLDGTDGSRENIVGDSFETFTAKGSVDISIKRNWVVGASGEIVNASSEGNNLFNPALDRSRSATEFNNASLFTRVQFQSGTFRFVPSLTGTFTFQEVNRNTTDVLTGEGTNQVELGAWGIVETGSLEPYAYGGYRYQDDGRAHLMPWKLGSQLNFNGFFMRGEVGGHLVVKDDKYKSNRIVRTNITNSVNAGSFRYYSVNPNLIEVRAEVGLPVSRELEVIGGATQTLAGEAVAYGMSFYGGVRYSQNPRDYRGDSDDDLASRLAEDAAAEKKAEQEAAREKAREIEERKALEREVNPKTSTQKIAPRKKPVKKKEFTPQLEDYDPEMFEKEINKKKK